VNPPQKKKKMSEMKEQQENGTEVLSISDYLVVNSTIKCGNYRKKKNTALNETTPP